MVIVIVQASTQDIIRAQGGALSSMSWATRGSLEELMLDTMDRWKEWDYQGTAIMELTTIIPDLEAKRLRHGITKYISQGAVINEQS